MTSITMETTDQTLKKSTRSITNVNPNASTSDIKNFAQALNALTTNTLNQVNRIDKNEIDMSATYQDPTLTVQISENIQSYTTWNENTLTLNIKLSQCPTVLNEDNYVLIEINGQNATVDSITVSQQGINEEVQNHFINFERSSISLIIFKLASATSSDKKPMTITTSKFVQNNVLYNPVTITVTMED